MKVAAIISGWLNLFRNYHVGKCGDFGRGGRWLSFSCTFGVSVNDHFAGLSGRTSRPVCNHSLFIEAECFTIRHGKKVFTKFIVHP